MFSYQRPLSTFKYNPCGFFTFCIPSIDDGSFDFWYKHNQIACIIGFSARLQCECPLTIAGVVSEPESQRRHPILLTPLIHPAAPLPAPHSPLRLHAVIFMHHQDAGGWWLPATHTRPFQSQSSAFIALCAGSVFDCALTQSSPSHSLCIRVVGRTFTAWVYGISWVPAHCLRCRDPWESKAACSARLPVQPSSTTHRATAPQMIDRCERMSEASH